MLYRQMPAALLGWRSEGGGMGLLEIEQQFWNRADEESQEMQRSWVLDLALELRAGVAGMEE